VVKNGDVNRCRLVRDANHKSDGCSETIRNGIHFVIRVKTDATLPIINGMHKIGMQFEIITKRQVQNWGHLSDEHLILCVETDEEGLRIG
jgi:hypothetical protein